MIKTFLNIIFPFIETESANQKLRNKILQEDFKIPRAIYNVELIEFDKDYKSSIDRGNRLEDKAKSLLIAWSITITLMLSLPNMVAKISQIGWLNIIVVVLALLAILYMFLAGMMVIQTLTKENIVHTVPITDRKNRRKIYCATEENNYQNMIRNNKIFTAYQALRNSVICLGIISIIAILPFSGNTHQLQPVVLLCTRQNIQDTISRIKLDIFPRTDKSTKCRGLVSEDEWVSKTH